MRVVQVAHARRVRRTIHRYWLPCNMFVILSSREELVQRRMRTSILWARSLFASQRNLQHNLCAVKVVKWARMHLRGS